MNLIYSYGQDISGIYRDNYEFIKLNQDSSTEFKLFIKKPNPIAFIETGRGSWTLHGKFLILNAEKASFTQEEINRNHFLKTTEFKDSLLVRSNNTNETLAFCLVQYVDSLGKVLIETTTTFDGYLNFDTSISDSIVVKPNGHPGFGLTVKPDTGYTIFIEEGSLVKFIGQLILKITSIDDNSIELKLLHTSKKLHLFNKQLKRKLDFRQIFYLRTKKLIKTTANRGYK